MFEVSLVKLPSRNCHQINVAGTYWKWIQHLFRCTKWPGVYTIMSCNRTVVVDPSAISRQSVAIGNWLAMGRRLVGDCILSVCFWLQKLCNFLEIGRQPISDWSATKNCVGIVCNRCKCSAISRQPVGDLSATCQRPPKTFLRSIWSQRGFTCSNQNLLATKSSLQPSATSRRPVADLLATTLQPPCDHPKFWSQGGRRPVASYVWPGLKRIEIVNI